MKRRAFFNLLFAAPLSAAAKPLLPQKLNPDEMFCFEPSGVIAQCRWMLLHDPSPLHFRHNPNLDFMAEFERE